METCFMKTCDSKRWDCIWPRAALLLALLLAASIAACGGAAYEAEAPGYPQGPMASDAAMEAEAAPAAQAPPSPGGAMPAMEPPPAAGPSPVDHPAAVGRPVPTPAKAGGAAPAAIAKGSDPSGSSHAKEDGGVESKRAPTVAQMLIYTAQLRLQVVQKEFPQTIDRVVDIAVALGGYIAQHDNASVQVRVPSPRFRDALKQMEKLGKVTHRAVQAQDVTEEYHDLSVRLKSLRATRDRLEQFLNRAKNIQEVLAVEKELNRLNSEIDRIEGRMRFLASRAAFSTITVALEPKPEKVVVVDEDGPPPPPPPPQTLRLPIEWLSRVGLDQLLNLD
ncbi:MAG: DUF4349 domain-containing protein [Deltaproteobacteria bacterium]|jgi:hypothetical protein|nr:DUF4349 domain-containing protein [Deltaproteobacteria bacterium]MBW2531523.1 DUF4349 domain-containing protein [Deltaproteobacteria bacterium]